MSDGAGMEAARGGALSLAGAAVVSRSLRAARGVLLARLVAPEAFGELALLGAVVGPLSSLSNLGLTPLIAREGSPTSRLLSSAEWISRWSLTLLLALLALAVAFWSMRTGHPTLLLPGLALSVAAALYLLPQVHLGVLQARGAYGKLARLEVQFEMAWTAVAILVALVSPGVWVFVLAEIVAQAVRAVMSRRSAGGISATKPGRGDLHRVLVFATGSLTGTVLWSVAFVLPIWLMQRHVGQAQLGEFSLAYTYSQIGSLALGGIAGRVALPALGRAVPEARMTIAWEYTESLTLILAPFTVLLAVVGAPLLLLLAGPRWTGAVTALAILAWGMAARVVFPIGALAQASGRLRIDNLLGVGSIFLCLGMELLGGWANVVRSAASVAATNIVVILAAMAVARKAFGTSNRAWKNAAYLWAVSLVACGLGMMASSDARHPLSILAGGLVSGSTYSVGVLAPSWSRGRYLAEARSLWCAAAARWCGSRP